MRNSMVKTFSDLCEELRDVEETTLLELLNVTSDDLVTAFMDVIEQRQDVLRFKLGINNEH